MNKQRVTEIERAHEAIRVSADRWKAEVLAYSHWLHAHPEVSGNEVEARKRAIALLRRHGFELESIQPFAATAFSAVTGNGSLRATLCIEYDALPGIGHACGHNVNAAISVGAAIALAPLCDQLDLTVHVLGTPAEEAGGGKVDLIDEGFFDRSHLALMAHAAQEDVVGGSSLALNAWDVSYCGKPAHAATAPELGINALDALIIAQAAIGLARQQLPRDAIISLIITEGGQAANVIPERSAALIEMRAPTLALLEAVNKKVRDCLEAGALASGAALTITPRGNTFADLRQDEALVGVYAEALRRYGRQPRHLIGPQASTDMGNVSQVVPSIHPMVGYDVGGAAHHTPEFAHYGTSDGADQAVVDAARALADCVAVASTDPQLRLRLDASLVERHQDFAT